MFALLQLSMSARKLVVQIAEDPGGGVFGDWTNEESLDSEEDCSPGNVRDGNSNGMHRMSRHHSSSARAGANGGWLESPLVLGLVEDEGIERSPSLVTANQHEVMMMMMMLSPHTDP